MCRFIPKKRNTYKVLSRRKLLSHSLPVGCWYFAYYEIIISNGPELNFGTFQFPVSERPRSLSCTALIFFKRVRYHLSAAGLLPGARQSFCESLGYVINDAESHHGLPTFGREKKASRKLSRNLLGNHVPIAPLVLTLKFKVAVIVSW